MRHIWSRKMMTHLVPFHKGNGTGGTRGTRLVNDFQGLPPIERTLGHILVPLVPLVSHIPRNGTEQDAGIRADFVPLLYRFVSAVSCLIQAIQPIHGRVLLENVDDFCSTCSACPTHSVERNGTRPMVLADRYGRSAPVTGEKGQCLYSSTPSHPSPSRPSQQPRPSSPPAESHSSPAPGSMPGFPGTLRR